jgi:hypothetical protein
MGLLGQVQSLLVSEIAIYLHWLQVKSQVEPQGLQDNGVALRTMALPSGEMEQINKPLGPIGTRTYTSNTATNLGHRGMAQGAR